jgi:hypothetical protein
MLDMPPKYYGAAAQYNKPAAGGGLGGIGKIAMIVGFIAFVILILIGGFMLVGSLTKGPQDEFVSLAARTANLQTLFDKQRANLTNGDLKKINAEAATLLQSSAIDLKNQAGTLYGVQEIPEAVNAAEAMGDAQDALDKAKVSGTFDRTYVTQLTDKVNGTFDLAKKLKGEVDDKATKTMLDRMMAALTAINDQLSKVQL